MYTENQYRGGWSDVSNANCFWKRRLKTADTREGLLGTQDILRCKRGCMICHSLCTPLSARYVSPHAASTADCTMVDTVLFASAKPALSACQTSCTVASAWLPLAAVVVAVAVVVVVAVVFVVDAVVVAAAFAVAVVVSVVVSVGPVVVVVVVAVVAVLLLLLLPLSLLLLLFCCCCCCCWCCCWCCCISQQSISLD